VANFIQSVDERTKLAGANRLEILLFSLGRDKATGREEVFGINVFKVREVMNLPEITKAPDMPPGVKGMVSLRGNTIPVVDLAHFCNLDIDEPPGILVVTEYNKGIQGFLVHSVEQIIRMEWNDIKVPPAMMAHRMGGLVTAVSELQDKRLVMILDVEKILAETSNLGIDPADLATVEKLDVDATVLFADDSSVARKQIETTLDHMGVKHIAAKNGIEAWDKLKEIADRADASHVPTHEMISLILTDVEMPGMDGYVLTKKVKESGRFKGIPVIMHSSLSADANVDIGRAVGADDYVPKFDARELAAMLRKHLHIDEEQD
jgi:two-component system chemotaxis response regulator CheV